MGLSGTSVCFESTSGLGYMSTISGVIETDPARSRFYEPFAGNRPSTISEADWAALQARARTIITTIVNPAYQKHLDFYMHDYLPHCARTDSVSAQPRLPHRHSFPPVWMVKWPTLMPLPRWSSFAIGPLRRTRRGAARMSKDSSNSRS